MMLLTLDRQLPRRWRMRDSVRPGFRAFCCQVREQLAAAGSNPLGVSDRALIDAWLAEETAQQFSARFLELTGQS